VARSLPLCPFLTPGNGVLLQVVSLCPGVLMVTAEVLGEVDKRWGTLQQSSVPSQGR